MKAMLLFAACLGAFSAADAAPAPAAKPDASVANYFGNSIVVRDDKGQIFQILYFKPDRTFRVWVGSWQDGGTWLSNNGQDSSIMCTTHGVEHKTHCHSMAPSRRIGDRWRAGQPLRINGVRVASDSPEAVAAGA